MAHQSVLGVLINCTGMIEATRYMDRSCILAERHHHRFKIVYVVSMSLVERQCENMTGIQWGMTRGAHRHHEEQAVAVTASNSPVVHQKNDPLRKRYH